MGWISKAGSYITYPAIIIPLELICLLAHSINPLIISAFTLANIAFSILALAFTAKWTFDGSLPQLSKDLHDFSLAAEDYMDKIDSKKFNSVTFYHPLLIAKDSKVGKAINSWLSSAYSLGVSCKHKVVELFV